MFPTRARTRQILIVAGFVSLAGCGKPTALPTKPVNNDVMQVPTVMPDGDPTNPKGKASPTPAPKGAAPGMAPPSGLPGMGVPAGMPGMAPPGGMPGAKK